MRTLDVPTLPPVDYAQGTIVFAAFAVAGLLGFGFTLVRVGRESRRPLLASLGATGALLAWAGMSLFLSNWATQYQRHEQVASSTTMLQKQLLSWDRDDEVAARYKVPGLTDAEVGDLISSIDFTQKPDDAHDLVGSVARAASHGERYEIELRWVDGKYDYRMDMQHAPRLRAAASGG